MPIKFHEVHLILLLNLSIRFNIITNKTFFCWPIKFRCHRKQTPDFAGCTYEQEECCFTLASATEHTELFEFFTRVSIIVFYLRQINKSICFKKTVQTK
ncbi:unnamed protein product [Ceratitis capitata]|uniref:(Mediterranean fruit fly) hypothetical protein n=1 Tax=Ceratitis capitata TaxID=7213 RepID=A0A811UM21_CERCA|nr:unnamed protein product [Ceratitis capitata]